MLKLLFYYFRIYIRYLYFFTIFVYFFQILFIVHTLPKKQRQVLEAARSLFWKHGFRRVSIEEVCLLAKVSKMTYYKFFANKTELAKAVYHYEAIKGLEAFRTLLAENSTPAEKIQKFLQMKLEGSHDISQEFLNDFYTSNELGLRSYIEEENNRLLLATLKDFKDAQQKGIFRKDFKPELLFFISRKILEMITDEKLAGMYSSPTELIMEVSRFIVYGIAPHD